MAKSRKALTVADLRELLADMPDDLPIVCTGSEMFPATRNLIDVKACKTEAPHSEGRLVMFSGVPQAMIATKKKS